MDVHQLSKHVGNRVRQRRLQQGITQAVAADAARLSLQTWSRLERGAAQNHTLYTLANAAIALDVGVDYLFGGLDRADTADPVLRELAGILGSLDPDAQAALLRAFQAIARTGRKGRRQG